MKNYSIYVKIDEEKNLVHTSGITFREFMRGTGLNRKGFLILAGFPTECHFNMNLLLEYVSKEQAELLYMSHMKKPLSNFKIDSLSNRYAYLCHDDGWWNNVYMEDVSEYKAVLKYKIMQELKGRKRTISEPDDGLMEKVFELCKEGLVIDFEKKLIDGVNLFCVGDISTMDDLESRMDRYRNKTGLNIFYNSRSKSWVHYES